MITLARIKFHNFLSLFLLCFRFFAMKFSFGVGILLSHFIVANIAVAAAAAAATNVIVFAVIIRLTLWNPMR